MDINVEGLTELKTKLEKFEAGIFRQENINQVAVMIKNNIFVRTNAGKDADFKPFKPYSKKYAKKEQKTTVNLILTGEMLNAMTFKSLSNDKAKIFFSTKSAREKAFTSNVNGRPIREFFGVNEKDEKEALKLYRKEIKRVQEEIKLWV